MGLHLPPPQNCAYLSRHNEIVIDARPIPALVTLTEETKIPRKSKGKTPESPRRISGARKRADENTSKKALKRKKPAAGGGAAGFKLDRRLGGGVSPIHIERRWEEECVASMVGI